MPRVWFETWNSTIQPKLDRLASVSKKQESRDDGSDGLLVVFSGDSTIIQQFQLLTEFVKLRSDFVPTHGDNAEIRQVGAWPTI